MTPALVIFDCDGVLVDSEAISNRIMAEAITAAGVPMTYEECRARFVGGALQRVIDTVEQWRGAPLPPGWKDDFEARRNEALRRELTAVPGAAAAVEAIRASETPVCVASSGSLEKMNLTLGLTGLKACFGDNLFSATMVAHGKPEPDLFLYAAEQMGQVPENCVVVEDSLLGVTAAVAAGMRVLAYTAETDADALTAAGAQTFENMAELPELIGIQPALSWVD
ncbi:HAD family hydrolase [Pelagibius marinus]|uniref:HAD family hydrolase n=1 Tax=Pelagibius marinus TaxID=2762760 RepID=UPI00187231BA|nr:HAD family hydrolase [Pelagibius marinus]